MSDSCEKNNEIIEFQGIQEALFQSEENYKQILRFTPIPIYEVDFNTPRFISVNDAFCQLSGYSKKELFSMNPNDLLDAEGLDRFQERLQKEITGQIIEETIEFRINAKDRKLVWNILKVKPTFKHGKLDSALVVGFDVTERKKFEKALLEAAAKLKIYANDLESLVKDRTEKIRESEQNYRELYESFDEAFIATDWELNVIHWNKAAERITTVKAKDALGKKVYDILPEMMSVDITPYFEALQKKQPTRFMMNAVNRSTGNQATFEISTYPSTRGIIIIVEDKTEEENTKRLTAIGQTAGMVGHDIRNPLQSIVCDVYLLRSDLTKIPECSTKEAFTESLDNIEKNVSYINKIVQDLQDYAKPALPNLKEIDVEDIIKDVLVKKAIPDNVVAAYQIEPQANRMIIDPVLLKRILANLVNNAVQAIPNKGKVDINVQKQDGNFIITVQDNGIGVSKDIQPKLFTPLFTTKSKGQGFGLAAVKRITEALCGTISFESQEGKGTKFIVSLPDISKRKNPPLGSQEKTAEKS